MGKGLRKLWAPQEGSRIQEGREGPRWPARPGRSLTGSASPGREGKGLRRRLPHPTDKSPSHRPRSLSWGPRGSPESQVAGALGDAQTEPSLDQVLQERDEAIAKKQALEAELDTCKAKLRAVEAQLLEVLEEKLRLRQEVEAWEEDMQQLVRQRVESQLRRESRGTLGTPLGPRTARVPWVRFPLGRWGRWR
ncbi:bicaudal D-related protein homolog [Mustela putorius furo]|uniref:Bicaudal D-related protein homolog n=1 Tax=Mustela putorius furo TaxID=9669 RepID=A0A8U0RTS7_MUSPF|nr:bicaudal D-related protein homolog [Mustela putorius furo]